MTLVSRVGVAGAVLLLAVVLVPTATTEASERPACPLESGIVVGFEDGRLRSDRGEAEATSSWVTIEIPAGAYEVTLVSWDALSKGQPREQWFLQGARSGEVVFSSPSTADLPEDRDLLVSSVGVLEVPPLDSVRARHTAFPDESNPNSVEALCAAFQPVAEAEPVADLEVTKDDSRDPVRVGEEFEYRLTVTNRGPDPATEVVVVDTLPVEVAYLSDDSSCDHDGSSLGGTLSCPLDGLEVEESKTIVVSVRAEEPSEAALNRVLVESTTEDPDPSNNEDQEMTEVLEALSVSLEKSNDADGDGTFSDRETFVVPADRPGLVGDVAFRARIGNTSSVDVTIVSLTDSFETPDGESVVAICPDLIGVVLGPGESRACEFVIHDYAPARGASQTNSVSVEVVETEREESRAKAADESIVDFVKILPEELALAVVKVNDADRDGAHSDDETVRIPTGRSLRADVEFKVTVTNSSEADLVLEALTDTFGQTTIDICPSLVGTELASGASVMCTFTIGDYGPESGASVVNTVLIEASAAEDPDNTVEAQDTSSVRFVTVEEATTTTTPDTLPFTGPGRGAAGGLAVALLLAGLAFVATLHQPRPRRIRSTDWLRE